MFWILMPLIRQKLLQSVQLQKAQVREFLIFLLFRQMYTPIVLLQQRMQQQQSPRIQHKYLGLFLQAIRLQVMIFIIAQVQQLQLAM